MLPVARGTVGANESVLFGSGTEPGQVRPFTAGDLPRRVHWPSTSRLGELHIVDGLRDVEAEVEVVLDTSQLTEDGLTGGVRLAAGLARGLLARGERVSLRVLGSGDVRPVAPGRGSAQDARIRAALAGARTDPASVHSELGYLVLRRSRARQPGLVVGVGVAGPPLSWYLVDRSRHGWGAVLVSIHPGEVGTRVGDGAVVPEGDRAGARDLLAAAGVPTVPAAGPRTLASVVAALPRRRAPRWFS